LAVNPFVLVDGAHNADGVEVLVEALEEEFPTTRWQLLLGVMGDKNIEAMVGKLAPLCDGIVVTAPESERAVSPDELGEMVRSLVDVPVAIVPDVRVALNEARSAAGLDGAVLVAGSLYLVGEVRALLTA